MSDISTGNLDNDLDSPKLARVELLESVNRVNALTQRIKTDVTGLTLINSNVQIDGASVNLAGELQVASPVIFQDSLQVSGSVRFGNNLIFDNAGPIGSVLTSNGPGNAATWQQIASGVNGSKWYNGTGVPSNAVGSNGDYYIDNASGTYYEKSAGVWSSVGQITGAPGAAGSKWYNGITNPSAATGVDGDYYLNNLTGQYYWKQNGDWTIQGNLTGPAGTGGGSGTSTVFSTTARYQASTTVGFGVQFVSAGSVKTGIAWTRTGTSMTFTDVGHGRSVGERAILRNTNKLAHDSLITAVTSDTFTVDCTDEGATSGTAGAYSMGFTFAYTGAPSAITGGVITAPANWDCVLVSIRMHMQANSRSGNTFALTVPKGNVNGAGIHTSLDNMTVPIASVRQDVPGMTAVGSTLLSQTNGDFGIYTLGALPAVTSGIHAIVTF